MVLMWLRIYTNHGQQLVLDDYTNLHVNEASKLANKETFKIIVTDSIHVVGRPGGIVLSQNPTPGAKVKENRKIYVRTTKYNADKIKVSDLPLLYGVNYQQKKEELAYREIESKIKSKRYDPGEPDYILEVWYKGNLIIGKNVLKTDVEIEKGDILEFVLSERGGGRFVIPDLKCKTLAASQFYLESSNLEIGDVNELGEITDPENAYVIRQNPLHDGESTLEQGGKINVTITQNRPSECN